MSYSDAVQEAAPLLVNDHDRLDDQLREIFAALEKRDARDAHSRLDRFWASLAVHIRAEHLELFPFIEDALAKNEGALEPDGPTSDAARATLERLREDHSHFMRELAADVNTLAALSQSEQSDEDFTGQLEGVRQSLSGLCARLAEHNRVEESEVYLWPAALLGRTEHTRLAQGLRRELENIPPRFRTTE